MKRTWAFVLILVAAVHLGAVVSATVEKETVRIDVDDEGRMVRRVWRRVRIHTPAAYGDFGESFFVFNPDLQTVKILASVTVQADGTSFPVPENAKVLQSPRATASAPDFSHLREQMVSHTALEPGCAVEFAYEIADRKPHRLVWLEEMDGAFPIEEKTVTVTGVPAEKILTSGAVSATGDGGFTVRNQEALLVDGNHSARRGRSLVYFELQDPPGYFRSLFREGAGAAACLEAVGLGAGAPRALALPTIVRFLNERLETVDLDPVFTGHRIRSLERICRSGYGTPMEKAVLGHVLLRHFAIAHTVSLEVDTVGEAMLFDRIRPAVTAAIPVYPATPVFHGGKRLILSDAPLPHDPGLEIEAALVLEETATAGLYTGALYLAINGADAEGTYLPLAGLKTVGETVLVRTPSRSLRRIEVEYRLEGARIEVCPLGEPLNLGGLLSGLQRSNRAFLHRAVRARLWVDVRFSRPPVVVVPAALRVDNSLGESESRFEVDGATLRIRAQLVFAAHDLEREQFSAFERLLAPHLSPNRRSLYLR